LCDILFCQSIHISACFVSILLFRSRLSFQLGESKIFQNPPGYTQVLPMHACLVRFNEAWKFQAWYRLNLTALHMLINRSSNLGLTLCLMLQSKLRISIGRIGLEACSIRTDSNPIKSDSSQSEPGPHNYTYIDRGATFNLSIKGCDRVALVLQAMHVWSYESHR
jgi:hypothetical protein